MTFADYLLSKYIAVKIYFCDLNTFAPSPSYKISNKKTGNQTDLLFL